MGGLLLLASPFVLTMVLVYRSAGWMHEILEWSPVLGFGIAVAARTHWRRLSARAQQRLEMLDRCSPDMLFETDARGRITFASERSAAVLGWAPADLDGRSLHDLVEGPVPILDLPVAAEDETTTWNTRWLGPAGEWLTLTTVLTPRRAGVSGCGIRGVVRDQHDRVETERALRESEERFRAALDTARNGIMLVGNDGRVLLANEALRTLLGRTAAEMTDLTVADVVPAAYIDQFMALMASRMWSDAVPSQYELQLRDATGQPVDVELTLSPVRGPGQGGTLIEVHDLTESRRASETIRRMADYDRLTGLPNRELFDRHVQRALIDGKFLGRSVAVLLLDVDRFKLINETLGHTSGDRLLQAVADRLAGHIAPQHILARFGGDEFLVLAPDLGSRAAAEGIARRVIAAFAQPFDHDGHQLKISASIGVAISGTDDESDADLLIRVADAALQAAKEGGRDRYVIGSESASDPARQRLELESDLRLAVARQELEVYYQPQFDARDGQVRGVEALLRWHHPVRGDVAPSVFVPLLEETGLIVPVGEWVLRTACNRVQRWFEAGGPRVRLAVNVSPRQLLLPNLGDLVRSILRESGLPAEALELELTETAAIFDLGSVVDVLAELEAAGVTTAIDDFGVGESWLMRLSDLPVRTLKVDRYFVSGITEPGNALAIVEAVVALGHAMGLSVIAEGVETESQLIALRDAGCDMVQGFYYTPALPADDCERFVEAAA